MSQETLIRDLLTITDYLCFSPPADLSKLDYNKLSSIYKSGLIVTDPPHKEEILKLKKTRRFSMVPRVEGVVPQKPVADPFDKFGSGYCGFEGQENTEKLSSFLKKEDLQDFAFFIYLFFSIFKNSGESKKRINFLKIIRINFDISLQKYKKVLSLTQNLIKELKTENLSLKTFLNIISSLIYSIKARSELKINYDPVFIQTVDSEAILYSLIKYLMLFVYLSIPANLNTMKLREAFEEFNKLYVDKDIPQQNLADAFNDFTDHLSFDTKIDLFDFYNYNNIHLIFNNIIEGFFNTIDFSPIDDFETNIDTYLINVFPKSKNYLYKSTVNILINAAFSFNTKANLDLVDDNIKIIYINLAQKLINKLESTENKFSEQIDAELQDNIYFRLHDARLNLSTNELIVFDFMNLSTRCGVKCVDKIIENNAKVCVKTARLDFKRLYFPMQQDIDVATLDFSVIRSDLFDFINKLRDGILIDLDLFVTTANNLIDEDFEAMYFSKLKVFTEIFLKQVFSKINYKKIDINEVGEFFGKLNNIAVGPSFGTFENTFLLNILCREYTTNFASNLIMKYLKKGAEVMSPESLSFLDFLIADLTQCINSVIKNRQLFSEANIIYVIAQLEHILYHTIEQIDDLFRFNFMTQNMIINPILGKNKIERMPVVDETTLSDPNLAVEQVMTFLNRIGFISKHYNELIEEFKKYYSGTIINDNLNFIIERLKIYERELDKLVTRFLSVKVLQPKLYECINATSYLDNALNDFNEDLLNILVAANNNIDLERIDYFAKSFLYNLDLVFSYLLIFSNQKTNFSEIKSSILNIFISKNDNLESEGINDLTAELLMQLSNGIISLFDMSVDELVSVYFSDLELESVMSTTHFTHKITPSSQRLLVLWSRSKYEEDAMHELDRLNSHVNK